MFNAFFFYFYECYPNFGWNQWQKIRSSEKRRSPVTLDGWVLCFFTNSWGTKPPCFPTIFWETYWTLLGQLGQNLKWFWNFWKGFSQLILESSFKIVVVSCCFICYVHSSKRWSISAKKIGVTRIYNPSLSHGTQMWPESFQNQAMPFDYIEFFEECLCRHSKTTAHLTNHKTPQNKWTHPSKPYQQRLQNPRQSMLQGPWHQEVGVAAGPAGGTFCDSWSKTWRCARLALPWKGHWITLYPWTTYYSIIDK